MGFIINLLTDCIYLHIIDFIDCSFICEYSITAIIPAFQAEDTGSSPVTR